MKKYSVLLTRSAALNLPLRKRLSDAGICAVDCPLLAIKPVHLGREEGQVIANLNSYDFIIFVSRNAVTNSFSSITNQWPMMPPQLKWFAVGPGTGSYLNDFLEDIGEDKNQLAKFPLKGSSRELLEMTDFSSIEGRLVLIVRGVGGSEYLKTELECRGARVEYLEVYERVVEPLDLKIIEKLLVRHNVKAVAIASGEALRHFSTLISSKHLLGLDLVVPSKRIGLIAEQSGFKNINISNGAELESMFSTIWGLFQNGTGHYD